MTERMAIPSESLLMQLPGYFIWKDLGSRYLFGNYNYTKLIGYNKLEELVGITDFDVKANITNYADIFPAQDKKVIASDKEISLLDMHVYGDGRLYTMLSSKKPYYNNDKGIIGVLCSMVEVKENFFSKLYLEILQLENKFKTKNDKSFSKQIVSSFNFNNLSAKESEVLFYYIRGKSSRETALLLNRSQRTIEFHFDNIKTKMGLYKKSEVIMYAIENGFLNYIPKTILPSFSYISKELEVIHDECI